MTAADSTPLVVNGWSIFAHELFLGQLIELTAKVEALRRKHPRGYRNKNASKRVAAIVKLAFEVIPQNPAHASFRQGKTLGAAHAHWCRAKFFQQYRLFFRYHQISHIIVLAWVNDEATKRAYESADDAYRTFRRMLDRGHPPGDWNRLLAEAKRSAGRLSRACARLREP
jgi:toxin YhaV